LWFIAKTEVLPKRSELKIKAPTTEELWVLKVRSFFKRIATN